MRELILKNQSIKSRACEIIQALPLEPAMVMSIKEYKKDRSSSQNRLYWRYVTQVAGEIGDTKDAVHYDLKDRILCRIYERDDAEYAAMINALRTVYGHDKDAALILRKKIVDLTSTTAAKVNQFAEYLDDIDKDCLSKGIYLERPEDLYREAMGT